ncbi:MAG TPA: hypothetical protein VFA68_11270 [Terriglobales bacterium]|nr:hypothetical protein [Terriglobales bacterium]
MKGAPEYASAIVAAHLLINIAHGLAHRELKISLTPPEIVFVIIVILLLPLLAMGIAWTARKQLGFLLLGISMLGSLLFGLYHHFLVSSTDHVSIQPATWWGTVFVFTAYGLLVTEAIGTLAGLYFFRLGAQGPGKARLAR